VPASISSCFAGVSRRLQMLMAKTGATNQIVDLDLVESLSIWGGADLSGWAGKAFLPNRSRVS